MGLYGDTRIEECIRAQHAENERRSQILNARLRSWSGRRRQMPGLRTAMAVFKDRLRHAREMADQYETWGRKRGWPQEIRTSYSFWCNERDTMKNVLATLRRLPLGSLKR